MSTINRAALQQLIDEDLAWLREQPRSLERDHIEVHLEWAMRCHDLVRAAQCVTANPHEKARLRFAEAVQEFSDY